MNKAKFTPGPWRISPISAGYGEFIIGNSMHEGRKCEVICTQILNPNNAQLIEIAPNMYGILKYISKIIDIDPNLIKDLKESIDSILTYVEKDRGSVENNGE